MADHEGRGSAGSILLVALGFMALPCCTLLASAATLTVGGSQGWTTGVDYTAWAAAQAFAAGDVLFFPYAAGSHNVVEVDKAGYDACSAASPIATHSDGNTNVTLSSSQYYFLCSFPSHCTAGMKLAVAISAATPTPASSPSTSVGTPSSAPSLATPAPASTPSGAPVPAPATSVGSIPTPSPANAPVPTSASVGTPPSASAPPVSSPPNIAPPRLSSAASLATALFFLSAALLPVL